MRLSQRFDIPNRSFLGLFVVVLSVNAQTQRYSVKDLGALPGQGWSVAAGINASAMVVGTSGSRAFLYDGCGPHYLGILPGGNSASANAINDLGMIAGNAMGPDMATHAVYWSRGSIHLLQPGAAYQSTAFGISATGKVVGYEYGFGVSVATAYLDGSPVSVPSDDDPQFGWHSLDFVMGANSSGQMAGSRDIHDSSNQFVQQLGLVIPAGSTSWVRITPPKRFTQYVFPPPLTKMARLPDRLRTR